MIIFSNAIGTGQSQSRGNPPNLRYEPREGPPFKSAWLWALRVLLVLKKDVLPPHCGSRRAHHMGQQMHRFFCMITFKIINNFDKTYIMSNTVPFGR
jgi:hypothetical protein